MVASPTESSAASSRLDQWVTPRKAGGGSSVRAQDRGLIDCPGPARERRIGKGREATGSVALSPGDHRRAGDAQPPSDLGGTLPGG
jgi:hypothetical protein